MTTQILHTQILHTQNLRDMLLGMTPDQYRCALDKLGFSQEGIAPYLGVSKRSSQGYALGEAAVPKTVAVLLRLMLTGKVTVKDIEAIHDQETKGR